MIRYRTLKTTLGRKYRVRMTDSEIAERTLYRIALVALPFFSSVIMFWIWVRIG